MPTDRDVLPTFRFVSPEGVDRWDVEIKVPPEVAEKMFRLVLAHMMKRVTGPEADRQMTALVVEAAPHMKLRRVTRIDLSKKGLPTRVEVVPPRG